MKTLLKELEMGYTPVEFRKTLQGQFITNTAYTCDEISLTEWLISIGDNASVSIQVAESAPRQIAMLTLPVLKTHFKFNGVHQKQRNDFFETFFRYFHKGGG